MTRLRPPLLAMAGGLLVAASLPPWGFWPLAFAGVVLFELALGTEPTLGQRAGRGFLFALAWLLPGMAWMWYLTAPGYLAASAAFAGYHAVAAMAAPTGAWRVIGRPAAHTLAEALRLVFPFGGVPLATIGIGQAGGPLLGVARVGGVLLLTWLVLQVGCVAPSLRLLARTRRATASSRQQNPVAGVVAGVAVLAAVLVVVLAAVAPRGHAVDAAPIRVAAVQGGGRQGTSALDVPAWQVTQALLDATATIRPGDADLVVWPENGIDVDGEPFEGSEQHLAVAAEAARLGVPFSVGVTEDSEFARHPTAGSFVNAQVVVTPEGEITSRYEKVRRVPFGEYVPLRGLFEAIGAPLDEVPLDATAGRDPARIELPDGTQVGVMISWEVFFGDRGRDAGSGAFLINPTNGASYTGTILQTQQIASSRLRAVENGRWVVQVSPTGFSAFVSPGGEVLQRTGVSERAVITTDVPLRGGTTWYHRTGDWPWAAAMAGLLAAAAVMAHRRTRPSDLEHHGDRAVVDDLDAHLVPEPAGGDGRAELA